MPDPITTAADPLDPAGIIAILEKLLGTVAKDVPIVGALLTAVTNPDVVTVLTVEGKNLYAELTAQFDSMRKLSPAARQALFEGMTPAMRTAALDDNRRAIVKVQSDEAAVDVAQKAVGKLVLQTIITTLVHV